MAKLESAMKCLVEGSFFKVLFKHIGNVINKSLSIVFRYLLFITRRIVPNKVICMTFQNDYTCNPKYITEQLLKDNIDCDIVWAVSANRFKQRRGIPARVRVVVKNSYEYYKELYSAKILVVNSAATISYPSFVKKEQIIIQTWHGSLGIKRIGAEHYHGKDALFWRRTSWRFCRRTNYILSNSQFETDIFRGSFWPKTTIWESGHPRNDLMFEKDPARMAAIQKKVRKMYSIPEGTKTVLYAPTFRDNKDFNAYSVDYDMLLEALSERFGGRWMVLTRFHPIMDASTALGNASQSVDVTKYPDIQDLLCMADVALTDYSSWIFDFVLTRKPGFLYAADLDTYSTERGLYYQLDTTPFPIAVDNDELCAAIRSFDDAVYRKKVSEFLEEKGCYENGMASAFVAEKIEDFISPKPQTENIIARYSDAAGDR